MNKVYIDWGYGMGHEFFSSYRIAESVYRKTQLCGITAELRKVDDNCIDLRKRIGEIQGSQAPVLIYIDSNWSSNTNYRGIETYYSDNSKTGELLAKKIQRELIKATNSYNRGIIGCGHKNNEAISAILKCCNTSIVTLIGFYSNTYEKLQMEQDKFIELISDGIFNGVVKYSNIKNKIKDTIM